MASTKRTWPSTCTILSRSMLYVTLPLLVSGLWRPALNAVARSVKDGKSIRTLSTDLKLEQQLAASNATADSRANEITDRRNGSSENIPSATKPETDAKHDTDQKILVVVIQDISPCSYTAISLPLCHGLFLSHSPP
jgi:hypothetical protein